MAFTNSFHSSARGHSIKNAAKLSGCQRHNSRGYQAWDYSADKISALIGIPENICADVRAFIDDTFAEAKDRYNEKQKRADRKISVSPFEHFNNNKKMDIATESILQVADKEFWDEFRTDEVIVRKGKEYTRHSFSPEVQRVMDSIFSKQLEAYEHIYETHKDEILQRVKNEKALCEECIAAFPEEKVARYEKIRTSKAKEREAAISSLSEVEQEEYANYSSAANTLNSIEELRLIERIENNQMHIKVVNSTSHYDENSPHNHTISVCWADGFQSGLDSRIAKSVVLNRWSLEVIQDRMHEIAQEEISKYPEIFKGRNLDEKQQGRDAHYSKEQYIRRQIEALRRNAFLMSHHIDKTQRDIENQFENVVTDAIANVTSSSSGVYDNVMFLMSECSDERFEELDREGRELKEKLLPQTVDIDPRKNGLINTLNMIKESKKELSWEERQKLWEQYNNVSREFWNVRAELKQGYDALISAEYGNRRNAMQSFYDAQYTLRRTRSIFVALGCFAWAMVSLARQNAIERKIEELKAERKELISNTASFKKYSNAYREELKAGRVPTDNYMASMESVVRMMDEEAAAQPRKRIDRYNERKGYDGPSF